jgi:hypothetical protein
MCCRMTLRVPQTTVGLLILAGGKLAANKPLADFVSKLILEINVPETQREGSFMRNSGRLVEAAGAAFNCSPRVSLPRGV